MVVECRLCGREVEVQCLACARHVGHERECADHCPDWVRAFPVSIRCPVRDSKRFNQDAEKTVEVRWGE